MREVRAATPADLLLLPGIEAAADSLFAEKLGWVFEDDAPLGAERASPPNVVLVVSEEPGGEAVGFVHVMMCDPAPGSEGRAERFAHLEQLSVHPRAARRGHGRALVEHALALAAEDGCTEMTLRTFAEVPWNRAFYESCGFEAVPERGGLLHDGLIAAEHRAGLFAFGARVLMARQL